MLEDQRNSYWFGLERWFARVVLSVVLAFAITGSLLAQQSSKVKVELNGVDGDLKRNVLALLELARAAENGRLERVRIERLHKQAEEDIRTALEPFGFYRPEIDKSLEQTSEGFVARYAIDPGPAVIVREVSLVLTGPGSEDRAFRRAVEMFPLAKGDTLVHPLYEAGKLVLLATAADSGYMDATFDTTAVVVDRDKGTADIVLRFETGPRFHYGPVRFEQKFLDEGLLMSRLPFKRGDPWRQHRVRELQDLLAEDPYFSRVEVVPERESAEGLEVPIRVVLEPRRPYAYELGAGYGTDTGPRGSVKGLFRRLNERGHHGEVQLVAAFREQSFSAKYVIPREGYPTSWFTFQGGYARLVPVTHTTNTFTLATRFERKRMSWRENISLTYQRETFTVGVDTGKSSLLIGGLGWERTRADSRIMPSKGIRTRAEAKASQRGIAGSTTFLQLMGDAKVVYAFMPGFRVLSRLTVGHTLTSAFRTLPPTLRYFTGGDLTVRGFGFLELGPRDSLGNVIGGPSLVVTSVESDFQVMPRWLLAVFTDGGNALPRLSFGGLERSVGAGIRYIAPIGLIRLDLAFAVSQRNTPLRLHLSVGPDL